MPLPDKEHNTASYEQSHTWFLEHEGKWQLTCLQITILTKGVEFSNPSGTTLIFLIKFLSCP